MIIKRNPERFATFVREVIPELPRRTVNAKAKFVARAIGVNQQMISVWRRGRCCIPLNKVEAFAQAIGRPEKEVLCAMGLERFSDANEAREHLSAVCYERMKARRADRYAKDSKYREKITIANARRRGPAKTAVGKNWNLIRTMPEEDRRLHAKCRRSMNRANRTAKELGVRGTFTPIQFTETIRLYDFRCAYCGIARAGLLENGNDFECDHIIPFGHGLCTNYIENIAPSCHECNSSKLRSDLIEWAKRTNRMDSLNPEVVRSYREQMKNGAMR